MLLHLPAMNADDLDLLDQDAIVDGYRDGFHRRRPSRPEDRSYMHGHRVGANERAGVIAPWQARLGADLTAKGKWQLKV